MSNIATNIEKSKHLLELGLCIKSADMCLCKTAQDTWFLCAGTPGEYDAHTVPAWSLSALLEVMPKGAELTKMQNNVNELYYEIDYMYTGYEDSDPITAAYEMVCWLLRNNLIEKGDNDE
jgi:hypothetical protein